MGEGDLGPLPRAAVGAVQQPGFLKNSVIAGGHSRKEHHSVNQSIERRPHDTQETERQLIIARGGSLNRKGNALVDDDDDIFNDRGGFRIKINKE